MIPCQLCGALVPDSARTPLCGPCFMRRDAERLRAWQRKKARDASVNGDVALLVKAEVGRLLAEHDHGRQVGKRIRWERQPNQTYSGSRRFRSSHTQPAARPAPLPGTRPAIDPEEVRMRMRTCPLCHKEVRNWNYVDRPGMHRVLSFYKFPEVGNMAECVECPDVPSPRTCWRSQQTGLPLGREPWAKP